MAPEVGQDRRRQSLLPDFFLTGTNALTLDGKLVNLDDLDGLGNRVAAMYFGPKKVIVAVGLNKVAPDGEYVVSQFESSFAHKTAAIEIFTPMLDKDGSWRVSGYFIK